MAENRAGMLEGKVVVVTGAGRGIGREIALLAAGEGAAVVVNDIGASLDGEGRDTSPGQAVVTEIEAAGGRAVASTDSVASWDGARRIIETALDAFGRIDSVVNNAGILKDRIFYKMAPEDFEQVVAVHLLGAFYTSRAAAEHFRRQMSGSLVHMTSASGLVGNLGQANYSAAKLGIVALSKSIALDMARSNVRSNCIAPFAWSRMTSSIPTNTPEEQARVERLKVMTPAKVAPMACYLCSDAAAEVSGQVFAVRANEIFLMSQPRPLRSLADREGWTPQSIAEHLIPALKPSFLPLDRSADVFCWDPV